MESHSESFNVRRMLDEELYIFDEHNEALQRKAQDLVREFNACADSGRSDEILTELLGSRGESCTMMPTIGFDYGWNTFVGENFYANMGLIVLDVVPVTIGDNCFFGPRVTLATASHPIAPGPRAESLEYGKSITIGNNVWLGAHVVVNPGVTIGDNAVIGSSSVVTKDIPAGVVAAGNPCRVIRTIEPAEVRAWEEKVEDYRKARG